MAAIFIMTNVCATLARRVRRLCIAVFSIHQLSVSSISVHAGVESPLLQPCREPQQMDQEWNRFG